jgi:hypothetical protein
MSGSALARLRRRWTIFALLLVICIIGSWWLRPGGAMAGSQLPRPPMIAYPADTGHGAWSRVVDAPYPVRVFPTRSYSCPAWRRRWLTSGEVSVAVVVWTCQESNDAAVVLWKILALESSSPGITNSYVPVAREPNAWVLSESPQPATDGLRQTGIYLARANYLVAVAARAPVGSAINPADLAAQVLLQERSLLPGPDHHISAPPLLGNALNKLIGGIIAICLLVFLPIRYARNPLKGQRYEVRHGDSHWIDVTSKARRLKWSLRFRALVRILFVLAAAGTIVSRELTPAAAVYLVAGVWLGWLRPIGRTLRDWKPRKVRGTYLRHNKRAWMEPMLASASLVCIAAAVALCLLDLLLYTFGLAQSPLVVGGFLDPRYLNQIPAWQETSLALLIAVPTNDVLQVTSVSLVLLIGAAAILRRFGRRFALADAEIAQQADNRDPVLYLRNFSDDVLKMPSSALGRTSLTERLSLVRLQPFEEIVTRHLRRVGPVIALAHPSTRLPQIGTAKVVRTNETWENQIKEWVHKSSMAVVAVTPPEVSAGLKTEIELLAGEAAHLPVLLVISPYKARDVAIRWQKFGSEAIKLPRFAGLAGFLQHNSGAHFMVYKPGSGWIAWGAKTRSEYTYAVSFAEAAKVAGFAFTTRQRPKEAAGTFLATDGRIRDGLPVRRHVRPGG